MSPGSTQLPTSNTRSDHLSKSGVIAISVVIPLVALGILIFGVLCLLGRRQRKPGPDNTPSDLPELVTDKTAPKISQPVFSDPIPVEEKERALSFRGSNSATAAAALAHPSNIRLTEGRNQKAAE